MRNHRLAIAGVALLASTTLISCGSDDDDAPANSSVPIVADSTIATTAAVPGADTSIEDSTETTLP